MTPREELKHVGQSFAGEPMETCRHCGTKWYSVHFKNGTCYECQQKGLHNEKVVFTKFWDKVIFMFAFVLGILEVFVSFFTIGLYGRLVKPTLSVRILMWLTNKRR
jgi:hypothetical protein